MSPITVAELRKDYGSLHAVDGISFEVRPGEVYSLLGHNGAGKTTTVEILEGFRERTAGEVSVLGVDPADGGRPLRDRVGIVLQRSGIEPELEVAEAVDLYGSPYRRRRPTAEVLELVGLVEQADQRVGSLSGGQVRRLDLGLAIVGRPELLFLDEPTTGFDPAARRRAWELIEALCAEGATVLLTTHYLDEAEHLADRVGVMASGRLVAEGSPAELIASLGDTEVTFLLPETDGDGLRGLLPVDARVAGRHVSFTTRTATAAVAAITGWASERRLELEGLSVHRPSLEDVFLGLAGSETDGESA
jgi:ABC-2 type transport system ATP-binding protein